jgi:glycine/serine hydroxymethyltransferase
MKEADMVKVGAWIIRALAEIKDYRLPAGKEPRATYLAKFRQEIDKNQNFKDIKAEIKEFTQDFPVPGIK